MPDLVQLKQLAITASLSGGALVALCLLVPALRRARAARDLDAATLLTFGVAWLINLPIAVVVVTDSLDRRTDVYRELVTVLPSWYAPAAKVSIALSGALAAVLLAREVVRRKRRVALHAAGLFALLLWTVAQLASGLQGERLLSLSAVALGLCLAAATVLRRGRGACVGVGAFGVTMAAVSGLFTAIRFDLGAVPCRHDCVLGSAMTGVFPNENLFGTTMVAALPFVYLGFRGRARPWLTLYVGAMAIASGSRGALVAAALVLVVLAVVRPDLDARRRAPGRAALVATLLVGALLTSVYIVQHDWSTSSYELTDRPAIWEVATRYVEESPVFGYGPERWETLYEQTGEIPRAAQHSTHNQWLDVLFTSGWVGVAILVAMIAAALRAAGHARPAVLVVLATVFLIGVGERAWSVGLVDFASFSLLGLLLIGAKRGAPPSLEVGQYLRLLRVHRRFVVAAVLAGTLAAGALAALRTPTYESRVEMFVSAGGLTRGQPYEGGLYAQQRMRSYAEVVASQATAEAAFARAGLRESPGDARRAIRVAVRPNIVLLEVTASADSPRRAKAIADALAEFVPARLEALERTRPGEREPVRVSVTSRPRLPASAVEPRVPAYLGIGALAGFVLALSGAVLRRTLDDRVRDEAEPTLAGLPVVGRIPADAGPGREPVVLARPLSPAADGFRALRANLRAVSAEHQLGCLVVSSPVPGEGKTHVVANLALTMAEAGDRVAVVDANLRSPALARLLGIQSSLGLTNVLDLGLPVDVALRRHPTLPLEVLVSGPVPPDPAELLGSGGLGEVLEALGERFELVLVDAPALLPVADATVLASQASGVVLVTRPAQSGLGELRAAQAGLRRVEARVLGIVLNGISARDGRPHPDVRPFRAGDRSATVART